MIFRRYEFLDCSLSSATLPINILHLTLSSKADIFAAKGHPTSSVGTMGETLHGSVINAEFSLQTASHNSRINNQRHTWSQIREF